MNKTILAMVMSIALLFSSSANALEPKLKMMATMAGYGVVSGALLGTASLAFGTGGRSIAKGASLGLYAGLLFGGYIILNYELKKKGYGVEQKEDYYPEGSSPYEDEQSSLSTQMKEFHLAQEENQKAPLRDPLVYLNFFNYRF